MCIARAVFALLPFTASGHARVDLGFDPLPCDYAVNQAAPLQITGEVPAYVNGSMYHALFSARGFLQGGVISVNFAPQITASFGFVAGCRNSTAIPEDAHLTREQREELAKAGPFPDSFQNSDAVTISADPRHDDRVLAVNAPSEMAAMDSRSLKTVENPVEFQGDSLGTPQNWPARIPGVACPRFFGPAHAPTDANGDLYNFLYIFTPKPAYRIWKVSKSTGQRTVFPDIPPSSQFMDLQKPGPAYVHQSLQFTERFIILPEIPVRMCLPPAFSWTAIQDAWLVGGNIVFRVLDKSSGKELGSFKAPNAYSWHSIHAYESEDQIHLEMAWQQNYTALDGFTQRRHGLDMWYWQGKLIRYSMKIPALDGSQASAPAQDAKVTELTKVGQPFVSPEFAVVHPGLMWRKKAQYVWALATSDKYKDFPGLPHAIKVDMQKPEETPLSYTAPIGTVLSGPVFVPNPSMNAKEDDGVIMMLMYNISDSEHTFVKILDATTLSEKASMVLPVKPASNIGLHNHYSQWPSEALGAQILV